MMRRILKGTWGVAVVALASVPGPVSAQSGKTQQKPAVTQTAAGKASATPPAKAPAKPPTAVAAAVTPAPAKSHRVGKPPATPSATLPPGAQRASPDEAAREQLGGGPTRERAQRGLEDPELRALHDAERVLFPRVLPGLKSGWSHDLPLPTPRGLAQAGVPEGSVNGDIPLADEPRQETKEWLRSLALPNLPVKLTASVVRYLEFYRDNPRGQNIARTWARKVGRYTPAMKAVFHRFGLPTDLVYLSLIESGHNPSIFSPAGAAGLWQFIPETGKSYGLTVDRWVDERLDPERSTEAAARYLSDLRNRFGSWELAMAAYNMGQTGLLRVMRQYNTNNFWRLSEYEAALPWETTLYVPKIHAIAIVMVNRKAFGLGDIELDSPVNFDTVYVADGTGLQKVAEAAKVPIEAIRALNPHYLAGSTPPSVKPSKGRVRWAVYVPSGTGTVVASVLSQGKAQAGSAVVQTTSALVRRGDTLETVAHRYRTTEDLVRRMNQIRAGESLSPGAVVLVPRLAPHTEPAEDREDYVVLPAQAYAYPSRERVFYRVRAGDTLSAVSRAFGVTHSALVDWNGLDESALLQVDLMLQVYVPRGADLSRVRHVKATQTQLLVTGSPEFIEFFEGQKGRNRVVVAAKAGDTLGKIGGRYGMSVAMMERINRFSRDKQLKPGDSVVVYTKLAVPQKELPAAAQAQLPPMETGAKQESQASLKKEASTQN